MTMTQRRIMAKDDADPFVLAGTGGVTLGEARTNHEGRKAVLLLRGNEDASEFNILWKRASSRRIGRIVYENQGPSLDGC